MYEDAKLKFMHGDLESASFEADSGLRDLEDKQSAAAWRFRLLKAEVLTWQGFYHDAVELLSNAPISTSLPEDIAAYRAVLLGTAYNNLHQLSDAEREFSNAERLNLPEVREVTCRLMLGRGRLAALRDDTKKSDRMFRQAAELAREQNQSLLEANALGSLGMLQMQQHQYAEAVDWFNASLILAQSLRSKAIATRTIGNLGWAYLEMGDLDRATDSFSTAEKSSEKLGLISDAEKWLANIAAVQLLHRDFSNAEKTYQDSLRLARKLDARQEVIYRLHGLAKIAIAQKQFLIATRYNQEAFAVADAIGNRESRLYGLLHEAQIASGLGHFDAAGRLFQEVISSAGDNVSLQSDALDGLAGIEGELSRPTSADKHYQEAIAILDKKRESLGREEFKLSYPTNDAKDIYIDYIDFLMKRGESDRAFTVAELHRAKTLTEGLGLERELNAQSFSVAETRRAAARLGRVILCYWLGPERSYLWVFRPDGSQVFVLPGEDRIRPLVERYRSHLTESFQFHDVSDADGDELYRMLVGPAARWIKPESQVTIIPDGALCGLNFETLPVRSPRPHYWIEDVSVTNASATVLLSAGGRSAARRSAQPAKTLLLIGNPQPPGYYPPLAHAGDEMGMVQGHFRADQETVLSGAEATPAAYFKAKPENYSLIHFVAHGTASRVSPLDSAVVLSEDGSSHNLYARDIAGTRLHARLVTVSACDSAGSRIYSSEGLVGLSWAFLRAGAQQVIAALWEVNDASTPRLMNHFYAGIAAGEKPAAALRAAKLELLRSQSVYKRPFYWAPFILYEGI